MAKKQNVLAKLFSYITYKDKKSVKEFYIPEAEKILEHQDGNIDKDKKDLKHKTEKDRDVRKPASKTENKWRKNTEDEKADKKTISKDYDSNKEYLENRFNFPVNKDFIIREFLIADKFRAFIAYMDGMVDKTVINNFILKPLLITKKITKDDTGCHLDKILIEIIETHQSKKVTSVEDGIYDILSGNTILYVDGCEYYLSNETKGFPSRNVEKPVIEGVITGAQEGFNETLRTNISLIRKIIKNPNLTTEFIKMGKRNQNLCGIIYIEGLVNPAIVNEVKRRIKSIDADFILGDGMLEQFIEDNTFSIIPTILATERPDKTASHIIEGRVAILCEGAPFAKIVPVTISTLIHSPDDAYMRFPFGTLLRWVRLLGMFFATFLPGIYIAITNFHQEMIPTDLLIAIAKAKENVPFPTIVEVILMEASFELIREAGIRIPGIIGNTLGIIGALILGQAAVQANIVSPVLIIVVAITGLGNFSVPNVQFTLGIRLLRFAFILVGALLGFFGITALIMLAGIFFMSLKSFGVPFISPISPRTKRSKDLVLRYPIWQQERRPDAINPLDITRQSKISRKWKYEDPDYSYDREGNDDKGR
jgi:Predicted membrane protein